MDPGSGDPARTPDRGMYVADRDDTMPVREPRLAELFARFAGRWEELGAYERELFAGAFAAILDLLDASREHR